MKLVIQRALSGKVSVEDRVIGEIGRGYVILCGVKKGDSEENAKRLADKVLNMRIMQDEDGKMNQSIVDAQGEILSISQFTLYAETKGRRPGFTEAEDPEKAKALFDLFVQELKASGLAVQTGEFGSYMKVEIVNDGPTTIIAED